MFQSIIHNAGFIPRQDFPCVMVARKEPCSTRNKKSGFLLAERANNQKLPANLFISHWHGSSVLNQFLAMIVSPLSPSQFSKWLPFTAVEWMLEQAVTVSALVMSYCSKVFFSIIFCYTFIMSQNMLSHVFIGLIAQFRAFCHVKQYSNY